MVALNHQLSTTLPGRNTPETCDKLPLRKEAAEHGQGVFFLLWPFCSCPASLVSRKFSAVGPGCAKCFFCCAPLGAATFRRGQSKNKKNHPGCFFFLLRPRGKAGEGEAPVPARGQSKKNTTQGGFFCCGPGERQGKEKPRWAPARGQSKQKTPPRVFFLLRPREKAGEGEAGAQRGFSFPCLSPGPEQKKTSWVVFFFGCGPARTLTHSLRAWGVVFFFFCCGPARTGVVFFFLLWPRPDAHCGLGRFRLGPGDVFCFFCCGPAGSF